MNLSDWANWALALSGFATFLGIIIASLGYVLKHTIQRILDEEIRPHLSQLQNNGGRSVKDIVDKTFAMVQLINEKDFRTEMRLEALERKVS